MQSAEKTDNEHNHTLRHCRACQCLMTNPEIGNYYICASCNSANYISHGSAEIDNTTYYNSIYSHCTRQTIERRRKAFVRFERVYLRLHRKQVHRFQLTLDRICKTICTAATSVEIGFGYGHELIHFLNKGANIYGIDLSTEAVSTFKEQHPEFSKKVYCTASLDFQVDALYSNALFEHLDHPNTFLRRAFAKLTPGGTLIMRLPLITVGHYTHHDISFDINFWKPCHRVLYTLKGLKMLLESHGFTIVESAAYAYYGYNVMSSMLKHGYRDVTHIRDPCLPILRLDSEWTYKTILLQSLLTRTICSDFALIANKTR